MTRKEFENSMMNLADLVGKIDNACQHAEAPMIDKNFVADQIIEFIEKSVLDAIRSKCEFNNLYYYDYISNYEAVGDIISYLGGCKLPEWFVLDIERR